MKILIIGGGGFQGSHLAEFLFKQGHQISVFNTYSERATSNLSAILDKINLIWGSVTDVEATDKAIRGHDVVFHLAAHINVDESLKDPLVFFNTNILGTYNVLEAVKKNQARLIYTSTCEVYGDGHDLKEGERLKENAELRPNSPYAASKASADRICYSYFKSFGLDVTIVRPFNVYGERQKFGTYGALIPILINRGFKGEDLNIFGDGESTRDYSHVSDVVAGYDLVLKNPYLKGQVINLATGEDIKIKNVAEYIAAKLKVKVNYISARPGEVLRFPADISLAKSLGYVPKIKIWDGIDRYLEWVSKDQI